MKEVLRVEGCKQGTVASRGMVAGVCALALLLILFALTDYLSYTARRTRERYQEIVGDWTQHAAKVLHTKVQGGQEALYACALRLSHVADLHSRQAYEGLAAIVRRGKLFDGAGLLFPDGMGCTDGGQTFDASGNRLMQEALQGREGASTLFISPIMDERVFVLGTPVYQNGQVVAAAYGAYSVDRVLDSLSGKSTGFDGSEQLQLFTGSDPKAGSPRLSPPSYLDGYSDEQVLADIAAGRSGFCAYMEDGQKRYAAYVPVGIGDWYLSASIPASIVEAESRYMGWSGTLMLVKTVLVLVLLIAYITWVIRRSRRALEEANRDLSISRSRYELAARHLACAVFEYDIARGVITLTTPGAFPLPIHPRTEGVPESLRETVRAQDEETLLRCYREIAGGAGTASCRVRIPRDAQEGTYWIQVCMTGVKDAKGDAVYAVGTLEDVTAQEEARLRRMDEARYRCALIAEAGNAYDLNFTQGTIAGEEAENARFFGLPGHGAALPLSEAVRQAAVDRVCPAYRDAFTHLLGPEAAESALAAGRDDLRLELCERGPRGEERWALCALRLSRGASGDLLGTLYVKDIHDDKMREMALRRQAEHDMLTGLYNRAGLRRLADGILLALGDGDVHAVLVIDLDDFKRVNDTFGHAAGDRLLSAVGARLTAAMRGGDIVARIGGDEFLVFARFIGKPQNAARVAEKALAAVCGEYGGEGVDSLLSCTVGAAVAPRDGTDLNTLYQRADEALYRAKGQGKGCYRIAGEQGADGPHK